MNHYINNSLDVHPVAKKNRFHGFCKTQLFSDFPQNLSCFLPIFYLCPAHSWKRKCHKLSKSNFLQISPRLFCFEYLKNPKNFKIQKSKQIKKIKINPIFFLKIQKVQEKSLKNPKRSLKNQEIQKLSKKVNKSENPEKSQKISKNHFFLKFFILIFIYFCWEKNAILLVFQY